MAYAELLPLTKVKYKNIFEKNKLILLLLAKKSSYFHLVEVKQNKLKKKDFI